MLAWLTASTVGKFISTFLISMVPIIELRLGLPYGIAQGLSYPLALTAALLGNMLPVPFIIVYIQRVFTWLRGRWSTLDAFIARQEASAHVKGETVQRVGPWGLLIFVAIPLPGTGAWTGALIAALLNLKVRQATPAIFVGVCIAAAIMSAGTYAVIHIV